MSASADRAYHFIKSAILGGRFHSGARLPEEMIANELGVSRTPVRDALKRLHAEQLVDISPYSGARVASWTEVELGELAQMRALLEGYAAGLAAVKRGEHHLEAIARSCLTMERELDEPLPDLEVFSAANLEFHRTIAQAADNNHLMAALTPLWHFPLVVRKYSLFGRERLQRSVSDHRAILNAIRQRDGDCAAALMRAHILAARAFDPALAEHEESDDAGAEPPAARDETPAG